MKIYLVGGAVRDKYLGIPAREKDWVVVGTTPEAMLKQGYRPVGKDFPVFLHPETHEEYALARTERKTAPGYHGFTFNTSAEVTLESDLHRRDLTINAMAEDKNGQLIDPYHGLADLRARVLRHVSSAFTEDPVRILRVARFQARYARLGFQIAAETQTLMQQMVQQGEANALVAERVWKETEKALQEISPGSYFESLTACDALGAIFPETRNDSYIHTQSILALTIASQSDSNSEVRFAAWAHTLGETSIRSLCKRLNAPRSHTELAILVARHLAEFRKCVQLPPPELLQLLKTLDAFRRPARFINFLTAADASLKSSSPHTNKPYPEKDYLQSVYNSANSISAKHLSKLHLQGQALAEELDTHRKAAISKVKRPYRWAKIN